MYYVYRIRSELDPSKHYIGFTRDLKQRLADHSKGSNESTAPFRPWTLVFYAAFDQKETALAFERYLKTGSGKAFARKRLWPSSWLRWTPLLCTWFVDVSSFRLVTRKATEGTPKQVSANGRGFFIYRFSLGHFFIFG